MAHVQREMELKQSQVSSRPIAAEIGDNFLNRLNKRRYGDLGANAFYFLSGLDWEIDGDVAAKKISAVDDGEEIGREIVSEDQPVAEVPPPPKKKRKPKPKPPTAEPPPSIDDAASECSTKKVSSSKQRQKVKAPKRTKGGAKALPEAEQPESSNPPAVEKEITESDRVQSTSSRKPTRPPVDAEFEAEMKQIEKLLDDSQSQRAKELLG
ncbi:hypothetical protein OSTOST_03039 [Ostertagia ostertagi]